MTSLSIPPEQNDGDIIRLRRKFQEHDSPYLGDIRQFASVNSALRTKCYPDFYKEFDSGKYTMDTLADWKFAFNEILQRHSDHLKKLRCRIPKSELEEADYPWDQEELTDPEWNQDYESRSKVLLTFIRSCPHLKDLDMDLDPTHSISNTQGSGTSASPYLLESPDDSPMQNLAVSTISQLTLLTHLSLSSPLTRRYYTETFLVDMISNMSLLQSFTCSRIRAIHPKPLNDQKDVQDCQSPLGIHLASLTHLVELDLERAQCVDTSWGSLPWKSSLRSLALEQCDRVTVPALHAFLKRFKSTLITLSLDNVPFHHDHAQNRDLTLHDLSKNEYRFELPQLINLEVTSPSHIQLLKAFQPSQNISLISFGDTPKFHEAKQLIEAQLWPNLRKLQIIDQADYLDPQDSGDLDDLCQEYGVNLEFDDGEFEGTEDIDEGEIMEYVMDHGLKYGEQDRLCAPIARMIRRSR